MIVRGMPTVYKGVSKHSLQGRVKHNDQFLVAGAARVDVVGVVVSELAGDKAVHAPGHRVDIGVPLPPAGHALRAQCMTWLDAQAAAQCFATGEARASVLGASC